MTINWSQVGLEGVPIILKNTVQRRKELGRGVNKLKDHVLHVDITTDRITIIDNNINIKDIIVAWALEATATIDSNLAVRNPEDVNMITVTGANEARVLAVATGISVLNPVCAGGAVATVKSCKVASQKWPCKVTLLTEAKMQTTLFGPREWCLNLKIKEAISIKFWDTWVMVLLEEPSSASKLHPIKFTQWR